MNEQELRNLRVLGIKPQEEEGENEQEAAEPAPENVETPAEDSQDETDAKEEGGNEQEVAEPAEEDSEETPEQTPGERARNAQRRRKEEAKRRQAEIDAAVQKALQDEREKTNAEIKDLFGWAKFQDGTKPIESLDQLAEYRQRVEASQLEKDLKAGKLTPAALKQLVAEEVAKVGMQTYESAEDISGSRNAIDMPNEQFMQQVEEELAEIRKYDPSIQSVNDLRTLDRADAFIDEVTNHGHSFIDAYKFVYADRIAAGKAAQAAAESAQRTMNSARSKAHMRPTVSKGVGDVNVPPEVMRNMKRMNPKATEADLRKYYQKYAK